MYDRCVKQYVVPAINQVHCNGYTIFSHMYSHVQCFESPEVDEDNYNPAKIICNNHDVTDKCLDALSSEQDTYNSVYVSKAAEACSKNYKNVR